MNEKSIVDLIIEAERSREWETMKSLAEKWISWQPDSHDAWHALGESLSNMGKPYDAIQAYKKGISVAPDSPEKLMGLNLISTESLWAGLSLVYKQLGQIELAIQALSNAIQFNPQNPNLSDMWNDLGVMYFDRKDYKEAFNSFKNAIKINPSNTLSIKNIGVIYAMTGQMEGVAHGYKTLSTFDQALADEYQIIVKSIQSDRSLKS